MIMVTHDVALKSFANRVVRMADGKIAKIEDIDPKIRNDHIKLHTSSIPSERSSMINMKEASQHHRTQSN
jgi:ABC-type sulfate/molybdate transport systems ATPase subunit